ncbi:MAG TPA: hypothetical protein VJ376_18555, partial [Pseudomonadota bacterium]|nr:hypothetical protein [Pseudomonadota bacterium]
MHPFVAGALVKLGLFRGSDYDSAFRWLGCAGVIVLFGATELYLISADGPEAGWLALPLLATPVVSENLYNYYFPDLFFAALCAVFFLAMRFSPWLSLPLLLLLHLTRESTVLLTASLIAVSLYTDRKG